MNNKDLFLVIITNSRELKELSSPPCLDLDMAIHEFLRVREIEVIENASGELIKLLIK